jgi:medium-chain acyl-[acyl-carrier-protein] hydrolase
MPDAIQWADVIIFRTILAMAASDTFTAETPYLRRARRSRPLFRLICFPHAGAGASEFAAWPDLLPPEVEVVAVQLPGRQDRVTEKPFVQLQPLVRTLVHVLRPVLDLPVGLFGHSGGALLAFELARSLKRRGEATVAELFPSGQAAPHLRLPPAIHDLPDPEFHAALTALGGTAAGVVADTDLMAFLNATLRADFRLWESYVYRPAPPLSIPLLVFGGTDDERASRESLDEWSRHTTGTCTVQTFPGGHFFIDDASVKIAATLGAFLLADTNSLRVES